MSQRISRDVRRFSRNCVSFLERLPVSSRIRRASVRLWWKPACWPGPTLWITTGITKFTNKLRLLTLCSVALHNLIVIKHQTPGVSVGQCLPSSTPVSGCAWDNTDFVATIKGDVVINEKQPCSPEHVQGLKAKLRADRALHVLCPFFRALHRLKAPSAFAINQVDDKVRSLERRRFPITQACGLSPAANTERSSVKNGGFHGKNTWKCCGY